MQEHIVEMRDGRNYRDVLYSQLTIDQRLSIVAGSAPPHEEMSAWTYMDVGK